MELANRESSIAWKLHHSIHDRVKVFVCTDIYGCYHLRKYTHFNLDLCVLCYLHLN